MMPELLLRECENLKHSDRVRRMVGLGRLAASDPGVAMALRTLEQGNVYERMLALQSCYGSYDPAHVLRALSDPSHQVRRAALHLAALVCRNAELLTALDSLLPELQMVLLTL